MRIRRMANATILFGACVVVLLCACDEKPDVSPRDRPNLIRLVPSDIRKDVDVMVVGVFGHRLRVDELSVVTQQAKDAHDRAVPVREARHPGEESKFGPYYYFALDTSQAQERVSFMAVLRYRGVVYDLQMEHTSTEWHGETVWKKELATVSVRSDDKEK